MILDTARKKCVRHVSQERWLSQVNLVDWKLSHFRTQVCDGERFGQFLPPWYRIAVDFDPIDSGGAAGAMAVVGGGAGH